MSALSLSKPEAARRARWCSTSSSRAGDASFRAATSTIDQETSDFTSASNLLMLSLASPNSKVVVGS
jgi:hypothetical protein